MKTLVLLILLFNPHYGQAEITWTQYSSAPTVLIGKFNRANVWSVIRINDLSHAGPQRIIDYDPHDGDRYVISECERADATINTCYTVAEGVLNRPAPFYMPIAAR